MEGEKKYGPKEFDLSRINQNLIPVILRKLKYNDLFHMRATCKRMNDISLDIKGYYNPTPLTLSVGAEYIEKVPIMNRYYGGRNKLFTVRYCVKRIHDEDEFLKDCKYFNIQFRRIVFFDGLTPRLEDLLYESYLCCRKLSLTGHVAKTVVELPRFEYLSHAFIFREFVMEKPVFLEVSPLKVLKYPKFKHCPSLTLKFNQVPLTNIYETFKNQREVCLFSYALLGIVSLTTFIKEVQTMDTAPYRLKRLCLRTRVGFTRFNLEDEDGVILLHQEMSLVEEGKPYKKIYLSQTLSEYLVISGKIEELSGIKPVVDFIARKRNLLRRLIELIDWRKNIHSAGLEVLWQDFANVALNDMPAFAAQRIVPMSLGN